MKTRFALLVLALAALALPASAQERDWPNRPVTIVYPWAAGATDAAVRFVAMAMSERFGQPFLVEVRSGGGGNVALAHVAKAPADGYTIVLTAIGPASLNKLLYKSIPYDHDRDFDPVILVSDTPQAIISSPKLPISTLAELVAYGKANPGGLTMGHPGPGTMGHLTGVLLLQRAGIDGTPVAYRGATPLVTDLLGGQIVAGSPAYTPQVESTTVLAITSEQRVDFLPQVPTAREAGFDIVAGSWIALVGPAGMPRGVVTRLNAAIDDYLKSPEGRRQFAALGMRVLGGPPERVTQTMQEDRLKWEPVIRAAKIKLD
jgi:tripartite-type tricarboxylate transporter receptor subunit TctC